MRQNNVRLGKYTRIAARRKKRPFYIFIAAIILAGIISMISMYHNSVNFVEGEITPKDELIIVRGTVVSCEDVKRYGGKIIHYFTIELDNGEKYNVNETLQLFAKGAFEKTAVGKEIVIFLDEHRGYQGRMNGNVRIAEISCGDIRYLKYEDYVAMEQSIKEDHSRNRWLYAIGVAAYIEAPFLIFLTAGIHEKVRENDRIKRNIYF